MHGVTPSTPAEDSRPTAVAYLRVKPAAGTRTGHDPEGIFLLHQREAILRKAVALGARVVEEYIEPGGATRMDQRPVLQAMLERLRTHRDVTYVIVDKLSTLTRNRPGDARVLASFPECGTSLVSATENIGQIPTDQIMLSILTAFNDCPSAARASSGLAHREPRRQENLHG